MKKHNNTKKWVYFSVLSYLLGVLLYLSTYFLIPDCLWYSVDGARVCAPFVAEIVVRIVIELFIMMALAAVVIAIWAIRGIIQKNIDLAGETK